MTKNRTMDIEEGGSMNDEAHVPLLVNYDEETNPDHQALHHNHVVDRTKVDSDDDVRNYPGISQASPVIPDFRRPVDVSQVEKNSSRSFLVLHLFLLLVFLLAACIVGFFIASPVFEGLSYKAQHKPKFQSGGTPGMEDTGSMHSEHSHSPPEPPSSDSDGKEDVNLLGMRAVLRVRNSNPFVCDQIC